jgi:hypothetical protein
VFTFAIRCPPFRARLILGMPDQDDECAGQARNVSTEIRLAGGKSHGA